jgi:hypothetical protein
MTLDAPKGSIPNETKFREIRGSSKPDYGK